MGNKIVTFSIAAYNVEEYLVTLLDSILKSKYIEKMEILIVNDGSTDNTAEIAQQYEEKYKGIVQLINKSNGGHGSTINKGIEIAKGKYFRAIDGDDWVDSGVLDRLIPAMEKIDTDMILTDYQKCYENGNVEKVVFQELVNGKNYTFDEIAGNVGWMGYHAVIFKTELLRKNNIRLDEHCFYVDIEYILYTIRYIKTISYYSLPLYCYRLGVEGQSVSVSSRMKHEKDSFIVAKNLLEFYKKLPGNISKEKRGYIIEHVAHQQVWHIITLLLFKPSKNKKKEIIEFDKWINMVENNVYKKMYNQSSIIKLLRWFNYNLYNILSLYERKIRNRNK